MIAVQKLIFHVPELIGEVHMHLVRVHKTAGFIPERCLLYTSRLFAFSVVSCGGEKVSLSFRQLKRSSKKEIAVRWKASSAALHNLLDASDNLLFRDVFTSLEI